MKNKTLLVITSSFPTQSTLYNSHFISILSTQLSKDFRVIILCPHKKGLASKEVTEHFSIYRFRYAPAVFEQLAYGGGIIPNIKAKPLRLTLVPFFFLSQFIATIKLLSKEKIDLIHAHWLIPQGLIAVLAKLFNQKIKVLLTSHGADLYSLKGTIAQKIKKYILEHAEGVTVVSHSMSDYIHHELSSKPKIIEVLPMGTDLQNLFTPAIKTERKTNNLLFVGRLVEKKGVKYLIKALKLLINKHPDLTLQIIGDGPEKNNLKQLAQQLNLTNHIDFIAPLSHQELVKYYQKATMACFPFTIAECGDQEGLGLVVVEAMGCNCPVVVGNVPAVHDTVKNGVTGLITTPQEISPFADTIDQLLSDRALQEKLSDKARTYVINNFDWEIVATKYRKLLKKI